MVIGTALTLAEIFNSGSGGIWYTRTSQKRMAQALRVRVSPSAFNLDKIGAVLTTIKIFKGKSVQKPVP